jgi:hypothetical protein
MYAPLYEYLAALDAVYGSCVEELGFSASWLDEVRIENIERCIEY